jgi:hypothetical protein
MHLSIKENYPVKNVVTRHCINPDILLPEYDSETGALIKTHTYTEFCYLIDRWKIILVEKYNAQLGQTIFLLDGPNLNYYALTFAAAELGLVFIVDWPHCFSESDLTDLKVTMWAPVDFVLIHSQHHTPGHPQAITQWEIQRNLKFAKNLLYTDKIYEYDINQSNRITEIVNAIWATPESDLIYNAGLSVADNPKKIVNSHKKVYQMAIRMANQYFTKNVSTLHYKTINHGASMCYYFLPSFMVGGKQYTADGVHGDHKNADPVVKFAIDNKIGQLFLYNASQVMYFLKNIPRVDYCLNIVTIFQITPEMLPLIKEKNINWIKSVFGDTTIGCGFFVKTADQNTDPATYDVTNMGPPLDDFFQMELRNGSLYVSCPVLGEGWKTSNDKFECIDGNYYFKGRANRYRVGDEWIELADIEKITIDLFGKNKANIVIDAEFQRIYLAVWEENIEAESKLDLYFKENYNEVNVSYILRDERYDHYYNSRKIDNSKIRQVCRERLLMQENDIK